MKPKEKAIRIFAIMAYTIVVLCEGAGMILGYVDQNWSAMIWAFNCFLWTANCAARDFRIL